MTVIVVVVIIVINIDSCTFNGLTVAVNNSNFLDVILSIDVDLGQSLANSHVVVLFESICKALEFINFIIDFIIFIFKVFINVVLSVDKGVVD